ncbi:hypothetical protein QTN25_001421 [Entamoeba marina]
MMGSIIQHEVHESGDLKTDLIVDAKPWKDIPAVTNNYLSCCWVLMMKLDIKPYSVSKHHEKYPEVPPDRIFEERKRLHPDDPSSDSSSDSNSSSGSSEDSESSAAMDKMELFRKAIEGFKK